MSSNSNIKIIGLGGCECNFIESFIDDSVSDFMEQADIIAINF